MKNRLIYSDLFNWRTTSRIKTVRDCKIDFPQENQAQQASTEFRIETGLALFLYSVVNWAFFPAWFFIRCDCQSDVLPERQKFALKITFLNGKSDFIRPFCPQQNVNDENFRNSPSENGIFCIVYNVPYKNSARLRA